MADDNSCIASRRPEVPGLWRRRHAVRPVGRRVHARSTWPGGDAARRRSRGWASRCSCRSATRTSASTRTPTPTSPARSSRRIDLVNAMPSSRRSSSTPATSRICRRPAEFDPAHAAVLAPARHRAAHRARRARRHRCGRRRVLQPLRQGRPDNRGYYSFDHAGVHFVALVNVLQLQARRPGHARRRAARLAGGRPQGPLVAARRSSSSRTCRCGRSTSPGAGAPAMPSSSWRCCAASAR